MAAAMTVVTLAALGASLRFDVGDRRERRQ